MDFVYVLRTFLHVDGQKNIHVQKNQIILMHKSVCDFFEYS